MVHPPRPGAQCWHHTPEGLSSSSTFASLQHSEQSPQRRSDTLSGIFASLLMAGNRLLPYSWPSDRSNFPCVGAFKTQRKKVLIFPQPQEKHAQKNAPKNER